MSIEAMKQWLEALDNLARYADTCELLLKETHPGKAHSLRERVTNSIDAIASLRQAIAEAEKQEPIGKAYLCDKCHTPFDDKWECPSCGHNSATQEDVYFHPQQRTWVGLTEEEQSAMWDRAEKRQAYQGVPALAALIQEVEAKLKEKNT